MRYGIYKMEDSMLHQIGSVVTIILVLYLAAIIARNPNR